MMSCNRMLLLTPRVLKLATSSTAARPALNKLAFRSLSSITYSGGQANEGQGGFYGSGGARLVTKQEEHHQELLAMAADVELLVKTMEEWQGLELKLLDSPSQDKISGDALSIRQQMKKLMTSPQFMASLNRLEINGEPVWGLNSEERELVQQARHKVNEC